MLLFQIIKVEEWNSNNLESAANIEWIKHNAKICP